MSGHTKGPLTVSYGPFSQSIMVGLGGHPICSMVVLPNEVSKESATAYANLFASAPDLLEALEAARSLWGDYLPHANSNAMKAMRMVDAAIAKARGEA